MRKEGSLLLLIFILLLSFFLFVYAKDLEIDSNRRRMFVLRSYDSNSMSISRESLTRSSNSIRNSPIRAECRYADYVFSVDGRNFRSTGERLSCKIFEEYLGRKVETNERPDFMKSELSGRNLELDIYDPITRTAIEYNGEQHYNYVPFFHKTNEAFERQKNNDIIKKRLCEENNIKLIVVPYYIDTCIIVDNKLKKVYLKDEEREKNLKQFIIGALMSQSPQKI